MEPQEIINFAIGTAISALGWFARELLASIKSLQDDNINLREQLPKEYVLKEDMSHALNRIDAKLDKIFDRLEAKQDKQYKQYKQGQRIGD